MNERWRAYGELAAPQIASTHNGGTVWVFDTGAAWLLTRSVQLDASWTRGLNHRAADNRWDVGLSIKF